LQIRITIIDDSCNVIEEVNTEKERNN